MLPKLVCTAVVFILLLAGTMKRQMLLPLVKSTVSWRIRTGSSEKDLNYGYFLHVTDMHVDRNYVPGSSPLSACHRKRSESLFSTKVGRLGAPGKKCDAPMLLMQQTLDWVAREWGNKLDFIVWTGDNARHDWDKRQGRPLTEVQRLNQHVTDRMLSAFPNIPIVPCLGNNDVYPHNQIVADDAILPFYSHIWRPFIPSDQMNTFRHYGYFSADLKHIRVLSLNTMYFMKKNDAVRECRKEGPAREHIEWLKRELERARADHIKVLIMGHVPPSPRDYKRRCFEAYLHVVSKYTDIIVGQLFGHLNADHFLIYNVHNAKRGVYSTYDALSDEDDEIHATRDVEKYVDWLRKMYEAIDLPKNKDDVPPPDGAAPPLHIVAAQVSPSVLPVYYPTVRIYRYSIPDKKDKHPFTLLGYTQFYANITRWEREHGNEPLEYELEYDTRQEYGLDDLSVESLLEFAKNLIESDDETGWITYTRNMFVRTQNDTLSR